MKQVLMSGFREYFRIILSDDIKNLLSHLISYQNQVTLIYNSERDSPESSTVLLSNVFSPALKE